MLKKISTERLRLGMHLHAFCGAWIDHPFWRTRFVITDPHDLALVRASGIREVWIDSQLGEDVEAGVEVESLNETVVLASVVEGGAVTTTPQPKLAIAEEAHRAARICAKAKEAVVSMFQEARMGKAIEAEKVVPLVEEISGSIMRNPSALVSLARLKTADSYTYMHSVAVCALMIALGRQLALDEPQIMEAGMAGLLHDLGKALIPTEILTKPGKLSEAEFAEVRTHPLRGYQLLQQAEGISLITKDVCLHHHERMDGTGYPDRLGAQSIDLFARMGAVCDVYDAITSNRPYKQGWDPAESIRRMAEWKGHFDPDIFQAFVKSLGIYPVGSFIRLESGRLGVVLEQSDKSLLKPKVKVFFSTRSNGYIRPEVLDLSRYGEKDAIVGREDPAKWGIKNIDRYWADHLGVLLQPTGCVA